ncbi:MAG: hypothetical protein OXU81_02920 [Gammaproteobacteria bacterium]|nr:hypothetical protein [Gammaproteobacteria bacterium]
MPSAYKLQLREERRRFARERRRARRRARREARARLREAERRRLERKRRKHALVMVWLAVVVVVVAWLVWLLGWADMARLAVVASTFCVVGPAVMYAGVRNVASAEIIAATAAFVVTVWLFG